MKCPRCGLLNPPEAQRCDCGYDFEQRTVDRPLSRQDLPRGLRTSLIAIVIYAVGVGVLLAAGGSPLAVVWVAAWVVAILALYRQIVGKRYWALPVLAVLTLPIGLALFSFSREVRLYCAQRE